MAKQFMVGYTGSPESQAALKLAIEEARLFDAKLFVINSQEGGATEKPGELAEIQAALQSAREQLADADIAYEASESVRGLSPGEDLVRFAADNRIDRIFVGVEKKSRTRKLILGSTAQYIILKAECPGVAVFDCDAAVDRLLGVPEVVAALADSLGPGVVDDRGMLLRPAVRRLVFGNARKRRDLEAILHPAVREECLEFKSQTARQGVSPLFVADVPLLFEGGFDYGHEGSLLVATTRGTQLARLKSRNGFDDAMAEAILRAQWPIEDKIPLADVVFWNEGPESVLRRQLLRFLPTLDL